MRERRTEMSAYSAATRKALAPSSASTTMRLRLPGSGSMRFVGEPGTGHPAPGRSASPRCRQSRSIHGEGADAASGRGRLGRLFRRLGHHGAAEAQTDGFQLFHLLLVERGVTLAQELDSIPHPLDLLLLVRAQHATAVDVVEQLVARIVHRRGGPLRLGLTITV